MPRSHSLTPFFNFPGSKIARPRWENIPPFTTAGEKGVGKDKKIGNFVEV